MRIAFTGSHGVGKSTLLEQLIPTVPPMKIFTSLYRSHADILAKLSPRNKQRFIDYWYIYNHWHTRSYLSARSIYDTWAYAWLTVSSDFHQYLFHWAKTHIWYDYLFYVPIEISLEDDGIRPPGKDFQISHDRCLKALLDYYRIPYHTITGTIEERMEQIRRIMGHD